MRCSSGKLHQLPQDAQNKIMYNCVILLVCSYGDEMTLNPVSNNLSCFSDQPFAPPLSTSALRRVLNTGKALDWPVFPRPRTGWKRSLRRFILIISRIFVPPAVCCAGLLQRAPAPDQNRNVASFVGGRREAATLSQQELQPLYFDALT